MKRRLKELSGSGSLGELGSASYERVEVGWTVAIRTPRVDVVKSRVSVAVIIPELRAEMK